MKQTCTYMQKIKQCSVDICVCYAHAVLPSSLSGGITKFRLLKTIISVGALVIFTGTLGFIWSYSHPGWGKGTLEAANNSETREQTSTQEALSVALGSL